MFSRVTIQPAGNLDPQVYSGRRGVILNRIAKMRRSLKTAKSEHALQSYKKQIAHEIVLFKRLNEQQKAETSAIKNDLELKEEVAERGFEMIDMNA